MNFRDAVTSTGAMITGLGIGIFDDASLPVIVLGGSVMVASRVIRRKKKPSKLQLLKHTVEKKISPAYSLQRNILDVKFLSLRHLSSKDRQVFSQVQRIIKILDEIHSRPTTDVELDFRRESLIKEYFPQALRSYVYSSPQVKADSRQSFLSQLDAILREATEVRQKLYDQFALESTTMDYFLQEKFPVIKPSSLDYK